MTTLFAPSSAPLIPWRARNAISQGRLGEQARAENTPNSVKPTMYMGFSARHLSKARIDRQHGSEGETVRPTATHVAFIERRAERMFEGRQRELHDARVDLAGEGTEAGDADHQPGIGRPPGQPADRRRFGKPAAAAAFRLVKTPWPFMPTLWPVTPPTLHGPGLN